jgi:capsular polysaccharide biosynthesis protein
LTTQDLQIHRFEDAFFVPGHFCLYDVAGRRIDATVHRWEGSSTRHAPATATLPADPRRIDGPVVFGGHLPKHFGHFLLESLGRTWIYAQVGLGPLPFVHFRPQFHLHERELLEAALRPHGAPLRALTEPTLLSSVLVPEQGIELGREYHPQMCAVYDTIRDELVGTELSVDETPIYLSRSRLHRDRHATLGERALELRLASHGVRILHPQELPLAEQVCVVSRARNVIGFDGSAMHLTIFRALAGARTIALSPRITSVHQARVDRLRAAETRHIHAQFPLHPRVPGVFGGKELKIGSSRNFTVPRLIERAVLRELAS